MRIRCRLCKTILDTEKYDRKEQKDCKCGEISLDWHGCKMGAKDFNNVDAMGDEKEQEIYRQISEYHIASDKICDQYEQDEITEEEALAATAKLKRPAYVER